MRQKSMSATDSAVCMNGKFIFETLLLCLINGIHSHPNKGNAFFRPNDWTFVWEGQDQMSRKDIRPSAGINYFLIIIFASPYHFVQSKITNSHFGLFYQP
jgi:hypothetical protein